MSLRRMMMAKTSAPPLAVSGTFATPVDNGDPLTGSLTITGAVSPYSVSVYSGTAPPGVTFSVSGSSVIASGNTTTNGSYSWTLRVTSTDGQHADSAQSVTVQAVSHVYWDAATANSMTVSGGGAVANAASSHCWIKSDSYKTSGKWQAEIVCDGLNSFIGMADQTTSSHANPLGTVMQSFGLRNTGQRLAKTSLGTTNSPSAGSWDGSDKLTIAIDLDAGTPTFAMYVNGVSYFTGNLPTGRQWYLAFTSYYSPCSATIQSSITYPVSGYDDWVA